MSPDQTQASVPGRRLVVLSGLALGLLGHPAAAQPTQRATECGAAASFVDPGHWTVAAVRRLEAAGLTGTPVPERGDLSWAVIARAFTEAEVHAAAFAHEWLPVVEAWWRAAEREHRGFGAICEGHVPSRRTITGAATLGVEAGRGRVAPGFGDHPPDRTGPVPLENEAVPFATLEARAQPRSWVAVHAEGGVGPDEVAVRRADVVLGSPRWTLAAGRAPIAYARGAGGGMVLSGAAPLDRVKLETARPLRMPWPVGFLGEYSGHLFLSRLVEERHAREPFFWGGSASLHPHARLTLSVHRAAMFDHRQSSVPVTLRTILSMLIGDVRGLDFENQIVSVSGRYRLPTEGVLPLTAYLEWGAEDAAGAWKNVPGVVAGLFAPAVPGARNVALGVEYATFGSSCCGNPKWYRHSGFPGSWAWQDRELGHGLGGAGRELTLYGHGVGEDGQLRWDARGLVRERDEENLFAPEQAGRAFGGAAQLAWAFSDRWELRGAATGEIGDGWAQVEGWVGVRVGW